MAIHLNKKIFWIVSFLIIISNTILTLYTYQKTNERIQIRALERAESLKDYFVAMRYVYHKQFINSNIDLNDSTVGFLPAHASTFISNKFSEISKDKITIRNVTDRPRNPKNMADNFELRAMEYFKNNPKAESKVEKIIENNKEVFHYTVPLIIEGYCIACHGKKEDVLPFIKSRYDSAYDYKIGDVRGVTSIKIPIENLEKVAINNFYRTTVFNWSIIFILLLIIYFTIKKMTTQEVKQKIFLQNEVRKKTAILQEQKNQLEAANKNQKELFSILRTVADCNQILITARDINELIQDTTASIHSNSTFKAVKILVIENSELVVKASMGVDVEPIVLPYERVVLKENAPLKLNTFDDTLSKECRDEMQQNSISETYITPLRKNSHSKEAIGVLSISTTKIDGLSKEEQDMINELSGDIGFAMNSFHQKEAINQLSFYDSLTYLANQKLFENHLEQSLMDSEKYLKYGAVLFIDFDNFKDVNDLINKGAGDTVLKEISQRLIKKAKTASLIARHGGDKFLILLENISKDENQSAMIVKKSVIEIQEITKEPFIVDENSMYLTCSIGVALFLDNTSANKLLNQAEYAMRTAKRDGKNTVRFYNESLQDMTKQRFQMIQYLKESILKNELFLNYQKQFDKDKNVVGVEALVRWNHPTLGLVSPAEFIPLAEESGIIKEIGAFVLESATSELLLWKSDRIKKEWRISVNVSPLQFKESSFVDTINKLITSKNLDPSKLRIELTEGVLIENKEKAIDKIRDLKNFGISTSIDDFGTGYSNLSYLKNLQIDELKIDQSFVFGLGQNSSDRAIVNSIIMLGEEFNFEVIAEGVETIEQFEILKELGCNYFQGYLLARPCKAEEL